MDGERILEAEPTITYTALLKLQKTDLLPNNSPYRSHEPLFLPDQIWDGG
jgi:hypothetical protein